MYLKKKKHFKSVTSISYSDPTICLDAIIWITSDVTIVIITILIEYNS